MDSAEASFATYRRLFGSFGLLFDRPLFARSYSPDWYRTFEIVGLPRERWNEADARWLDLYAQEEARLLPGAAEALSSLTSAGLKAALVTSGSRSRIEREIEAFGLATFFGAVVCSEDSPRRKPDPAPLRLALERLGTVPEQAVCVGDSPEDIVMARGAGVFSVGVPGGFPNREALEASAPDLLAADLAEAVARILSMGAP